MKTSIHLFLILILTGVIHQAAFAEKKKDATSEAPRIVNIINFIRAVEPRLEMDLFTPVKKQIELVKKYDLPATFLLQYDAFFQGGFVELLKKELPKNCEVGVWLEIVQPLVEKAGLTWRGRYPWDWHSDVGFTVGYTPQEREKLIDVVMEDFKTLFGVYPASVGSWFIDAHTLGYMADKYGVRASCNCKDQIGTDGYTLWGGYWNQAYYPSRKNAFMPAQSQSEQIPIPIFRMLGSDPIYQYDANLGGQRQSVISLEPVYKDGGGNPKWVRWFFDIQTEAPCLAFAYAQVGQENSFGWPAMKDGFTDQIKLLKKLRKKGKIRVETLVDSADWFRKNFPLTPATAVTALDDFRKEGRSSLWYNSRHYRVNLLWENGEMRVRDLHLFDERYPERYLGLPVSTNACTYDTLPIVDGFQWSTAEKRAGIYPIFLDENEQPLPMRGGKPEVHEIQRDVLQITWPLEDQGKLILTLRPESMEWRILDNPRPWVLALRWDFDKPILIWSDDATTVSYIPLDPFARYKPILTCQIGDVTQNGDTPEIRIHPHSSKITLFPKYVKFSPPPSMFGGVLPPGV